MDSLIAAAARCLDAGDTLGALKRVALREDPSALALRGIAMARLGELARSRELLRRAAGGFGAHEALARARCVVAQAEVALAMRDLGTSARPLVDAMATLDARADRANALHARLVAARRLLLLGRLADAGGLLDRLHPHALQGVPPALLVVAALARAELALRSLRPQAARTELVHAQQALAPAGLPGLQGEMAQVQAVLDRPAARRGESLLRLDEVAALQASGALVVDACRRGLRHRDVWLPLARRPVLFALLRALAAAWPADAGRDELIEIAFRTRRPDETHRARLRVEIGRLRALVKDVAGLEATPRGFALVPRDGCELAVIAPPIEGEQGALLALLSDGAAWSTSSLALALGASQRTVQRALAELEAQGRVRCTGRARTQRWLAPPLAGFTTILLLPTALPPA